MKFWTVAKYGDKVEITAWDTEKDTSPDDIRIIEDVLADVGGFGKLSTLKDGISLTRIGDQEFARFFRSQGNAEAYAEEIAERLTQYSIRKVKP